VSTGADATTGLDDRTGELEARLARYPVDRYPVQHATTAFHLGTAHLQRGSVTQALRLVTDAHAIFDRLGMRLEQAKALTMKGVAEREAGQLDPARHSFTRAVAAFEELDQPAEQGAACFNLGLVLQEQHQTALAQAAMAAARGLFLQSGQPAQAGAASREQGAALLRSGHAEQALPLLTEAATLAEHGGDLAGLGAAANVLGLAHLALNSPHDAIAALGRAVGAFPRSMRPAEHAMAKANLATAYEQGGNAARARLAARQARAIPDADPQVLAQAQQVLDRLNGDAGPDLLAVLDAEPADRWTAIVREEAVRWCGAEPAERLAAVGGFLDGLLARPGAAYDVAESLLAVVLELSPEPYERLVRTLVQATGSRDEDDRERLQALLGSAMARFAIPQWQRLAGSLNAAAVDLGHDASWR